MKSYAASRRRTHHRGVRRRAFLLRMGAGVLAVAARGSRALAQQAPTLDRLLSSFAALPGLRARFREEKRIALLAMPIRSEGEILYTPGKLLRRVTAPTPSVAVIDAARLVMRAGDDRQVIELRDNPVVAGFVGSIRHVLAGDRAALEQAYTVDFQTEGNTWRLQLRPRQRELGRFLREMVLEGEDVRLVRMRMVEVSGDETNTEFFDIDPNRRFSAAEVRTLFRVE